MDRWVGMSGASSSISRVPGSDQGESDQARGAFSEALGLLACVALQLVVDGYLYILSLVLHNKCRI